MSFRGRSPKNLIQALLEIFHFRSIWRNTLVIPYLIRNLSMPIIIKTSNWQTLNQVQGDLKDYCYILQKLILRTELLQNQRFFAMTIISFSSLWTWFRVCQCRLLLTHQTDRFRIKYGMTCVYLSLRAIASSRVCGWI